MIDNDIIDKGLDTDTFSLRCAKGSDGQWSWTDKFDEDCTLTDISNSFDSNSVEVIDTDNNVIEINSNQFMYGKGNVNQNRGKVYSDSAVTHNYGEVYGNGNVTNNYVNVYGNGNVTDNNTGGKVYGNGNVNTKNYSFVYGNGNVTNNNFGKVYGNGNVKTNIGFGYGKVYGNGNVDNNDNGGKVYGNGTIKGNDNGNVGTTVEDKTKTITNPEDNLYGNGYTIIISKREEKRVINGDIITDTPNDAVLGNTVTTNSNDKSAEPNAIVNSSVIRCSGTSKDAKLLVYGNDITGNNNIVNGFRIYKIDEKNEKIEHILVGNVRTGSISNYGYTDLAANVIIGNYNVINPNYISDNKNDVEVAPNVVIGNYNVINDPYTIVLKGTCNVFNSTT